MAEKGSFAGAVRKRVRGLKRRFAQKCISLELGLGRVAACWQGGRRDACLWQAPAQCRGVQQCVCTQAAWGELSVQGRSRLPLLVSIVPSLDGGLAGSHFCSCCSNRIILAAVYVLIASEVLNILPSVVRYDLGNGLC